MIDSKRILVIGDVMMDVYYEGEVNRISPEAPVPIFMKKSERNVLGGAANVAANLIAANQQVSMMTIIGDDSVGAEIIRKLKDASIDTRFVIRTKRHTTTKVRFIASNNQQVMRLDEEDTFSITSEECEKFLLMLKDEIGQFDLVVFSDYLKGLLTYDFTQGVIKIAKEVGIKVFIDVKDSNVAKYKGAYLLKPNQKELHVLTGLPVETEEEIIIASQELRRNSACQFVLATCGSKGMRLVGDKEVFIVNSVGKEVFDVTGAGDTTISYLCACAANNMDLKRAVEIANYAAGLQVAKVGTSAVYVDEVLEVVRNEKEGVIHKLVDYKKAKDIRKIHEKRQIVFTNGCFDILHVGHIRYLQEASKLGDLLIVGLNSDSSVKRLKGDNRPINTERERAEILCALEYVDYVILFDEDTPYELIKVIQPDVLVKGNDYKPNEVVGRDIVEARGGRLELIKVVKGKSTTNIVDRIISIH
ncbi:MULTISPECIES: D-glycero-beta-D-manno-heptose 1-phosphate adenylyltransferase [unclassified Clostridium]|uniref:D-glycero-beta-D-manno-heptose 1-phosphate adenylyltransferase n=1 Tax=unclassified Clostridium TaxID=2614128 RepID=UPI001105FC1A|nr:MULTISPECIES: D-glycero-beta-D-manno-heptose 1-phosphate adenylyltransferase [unclassified Clostridium]